MIAVKNKRAKMPKRRSSKFLSDKNESSRESFDEVTLQMMKEMDVTPLEENPVEFRHLFPFQQLLTAERARKAVEEQNGDQLYHKTAAKGGRDEFVLYRKHPHNQPCGIDHFSTLSDEIILHIFHWLPKRILVTCSEVCKRWKDISYDDSLWKRYDFGRRVIKPNTIEILLQRGIIVLRLAMSEIKSPVFSENFNQNNHWFSNLQFLDLSMATIRPEELSVLLSVCRSLEKLSVEHCTLNEDCCKYIAQNNRLSVLNMAMCSGCTPSGLAAISANCTRLKEWNLAWTNLSTECFQAFHPIVPKTIKRFNISGHRETLGDRDLIEVLNRCPNLIELDVSDCQLLTEESFEVLVRNCSRLEHLHTSRCYHIPTSCNRLLKSLKHFKALEIFRTLTDEALAALRDFMPDVQINQFVFSTVARPTTGIRRTSIWGIRVRD